MTALAATSLALAVGVALAASASPVSTNGNLTIRHVTQGCHLWSPGGGSLAKSSLVVLRAGQALTVANRDNCGLRLVQTDGTEAFARDGDAEADGVMLAPLGEPAHIVFNTVGTYRFALVEDEDVALDRGEAGGFGLANLTSTGVDNTLTLTVRVIPDRNHPSE